MMQSTTIEIWPVPESDNVQSLLLESGYLHRNSVSADSGDQIGSIATIWLESG
jgi:hypothetical protein